MRKAGNDNLEPLDMQATKLRMWAIMLFGHDDELTDRRLARWLQRRFGVGDLAALEYAERIGAIETMKAQILHDVFGQKS